MEGSMSPASPHMPSLSTPSMTPFIGRRTFTPFHRYAQNNHRIMDTRLRCLSWKGKAIDSVSN